MSANPAATENRLATPFVAVLVCTFSIFLLSAMDAVMKGLVLAVGVYNTVLWRSVLAALVSGAAWMSGPRVRPKRPILSLHIQRAVVIGVVLILFFWGVARLPLAEAIALSFIAPLIALFMAALLLGEHIRKQAIWASLAGIAGVAIVMAGQLGRPTHGPDAWLGAASILVSTFFYAYNLILARKQALVAKPLEITFFQSMALTLMLLGAAPWLAHMLPENLWLPIAAATALSMSGQMLMSWAYARAEAQYLIPTEYTSFVWAAGLGWFFFNEPVASTTYAGAALIIAGCLVAARANPKLAEPIEATV